MTDQRAADNAAIVTAVQNLHTDLAAWLGTEASYEVLERFAAAQHPDLTMVSTDGSIVAREPLLAGLREARNAVPGLRIEIDELIELNRVSDTVVIRFRETHHTPAETTARRVTAVLLTAPDGYLWQSVHETAIP
ncbi:hypothetical protein JK358_15625 [Nocardia sp. 2]|uniref:DUF4440 domain-containing protein n=1 Tax=Nocardia acididurans TaxID=2802282 RepID=A0ABS1M6Z8_9NOCA|nr:hypothetical protein [Nocardia acididurans]MBL1075825.1 hypothetical protein [Nocardia acididurans]